MSEPQNDLTDADFSVGRSRLGRIKHRVVELPSRLRLAGQGACGKGARTCGHRGCVSRLLGHHDGTGLRRRFVPTLL